MLIKTEMDIWLSISSCLTLLFAMGMAQLPTVLGSGAPSHFGSEACCVFVNHLALGGNGCLLHVPAISWQAPTTAETMGMCGK